MTSLGRALGARADIKLCIATAYPGFGDLACEVAGVEYHVVGQPLRRSIFEAHPSDLTLARRLRRRLVQTWCMCMALSVSLVS
jgi:hypothetical protein